MNHKDFSLTELIRDDDFIQWVKSPDTVSDAYWADIIKRYPERKKVIEMAKDYVLLIASDTGRHIPTEEQSRKMWTSVKMKTAEYNYPVSEMNEEETGHRLSPYKKWMVAAGIAMVLSLGYLMYAEQQHTVPEIAFGTEQPGNLQVIQNSAELPLTVLLSDGSSLILQPGAEITFDDFEGKDKRRVDLKGKAFFEVAKNPEWPFMVYTKGIVTRVLGTSFEIDAPENGTEISIAVTTGKVSVYKAEEGLSDEPEDSEKVILEKNQKMAFDVSGRNMVYKPVPKVMANPSDIDDQLFIFDEAAVSDIFDALESHYGVTISYDSSIMGNCPLTATLTGYPLKKKMEIICSALMADFTVAGNHINVTGKGCR